MSCHSTHLGILATQYAKAITNLDDAQTSSIFHRTKSTNADAPAPDPDEAIAALARMSREIQDDHRLSPAVKGRLSRRIEQAQQAINEGSVPDGRTWAATLHTPLEAEVAQRNLDRALASAARQQDTSPDHIAAQFRKWRQLANYEDVEAPDPAFHPDPTNLPSDKHTRRALRKLGWENYLHQPLPVFTYGTLRKGQGNDRLMNGAIDSRSEQAEVTGIAIYGADRGFPYAQEAPDGRGITRGDIVYLTADEHGRAARRRLDDLEGFDSDHPTTRSHYRRVALDVTFADPATRQQRTTKAWAYLAGSYAQQDLREADRIADGDWVKARDAYRAYGREGTSATQQTSSENEKPSNFGGFRVIKAATDPDPHPKPHQKPQSSAADSAAVFRNAGLLGDADRDEHGGFLSQFNE